MQVFCPADAQDLTLGLPNFLGSPNPVYIRHNPLDPVFDHHRDFQIGRAEVIGESADVAILVYGTLFSEAYNARELLQTEGISAGLLNLRTVQPIDEGAILRATRRARLLVTLEDHFLTGGLYSMVSEILTRHRMSISLLPLALDHRWFKPALLPDILQYEGFTAPQIAETIIQELNTVPECQQ
jgi:transketolase